MAGTIIIFDTEATDLQPGQICQLSYLMLADGAVEARNYYFSVDDMSPGAQEVHGLSMERLHELSGQTWFEDKAEEILQDFNQARLLVGHNVAADERYLRVEMERAGLKLKKIPTFCTMNFASGIMNMQRKVVTGRPKPPKLSELAAFYGVSEDEVLAQTRALFKAEDAGLHDARFDTVMTWLSFAKALEASDLRGI